MILCDRYSGWLSIYPAGQGKFDGLTLVGRLRSHFETIGVAEEFSSDMGPQMMSDLFQKFMLSWGVHHMHSSSYFPHSNAGAELAVKNGKRLLNDNTDNKGSLNTDDYVMSVTQSQCLLINISQDRSGVS